MGKKLNIEDVRKIFSDGGCILLDDNYISATSKMKYICNCGEIDYKSVTHFKRGQRCEKCGRKKQISSQVFSQKYVEEYLNENGYSINGIYKNARSIMELNCPNNHIYKVTFEAFKRGDRCQICQGRNRYDYEFVFTYFKENGCELLEKEYISTNTLMKYKCKCGDISEIRFSCFLNGQRCRKCGDRKIAEKQRNDFNEIIQFYRSNGCILLSKESDYERKDTSKLTFICKCGNIHSSIYSSFKVTRQCDECGNKQIGEKNRKYSVEMLKIMFEERGFKLISTEYINSKIPLEFICDKGHSAKTHIDHFKNGAGCKQCAIDKMRGENSPNWNPNRTNEERLYRRQYDGYDQWRKSVFERDNYYCQVCGNNGNLNAHHLNSHHWAVDERTNINNGITLCDSCHNDFHLCYGNRDNTREQFEEYMEGISWDCKGLYNNLVV